MKLPKNTHPHDENWIISQIQQLPAHLRPAAIKGYEKVFSENYDSEPTEHKKMNKARFAANTRLREYVEKIIVL